MGNEDLIKKQPSKLSLTLNIKLCASPPDPINTSHSNNWALGFLSSQERDRERERGGEEKGVGERGERERERELFIVPLFTILNNIQTFEFGKESSVRGRFHLTGG